MKTTANYRNKSGRSSESRYEDNTGRYSDDAYRRNREDRFRAFPEDRNYENSYDRDNRSYYEKDYNAYDRMHMNRNSGRGHNAYNSDTRRDPDSYNFRRSGGYGRQSNPDTNGYYDADSQSYNDRYSTGSDIWPKDRERRTYTSAKRRDTSYNRNSGNNNNYDSRYNEYRDFDNYGYNGRNASDYNSRYYGENSYDPADHFNRRDGRGYTYRYDEDYERENRNPGPEGRYSWGRENARTKGDYGYYESYPSYGQSETYNDHERYAGKRGNYRSHTDEYGETGYEDNYARPNIRDRRTF